MHRGGEGTHKDGGTEIWVFDLTSHRRLARWPVHSEGLTAVVAIQVSQDSAPIVFASTATAQLAVIDALTGRVRHIEKHLGQTPWQLLNP
jgi:methylamine dehydrogenase heavy chain